MSWITVKETILAISWVSIFFLLGFGKFIGIDLTGDIRSSGISMAQILAAGQAYILFAFYNKYI